MLQYLISKTIFRLTAGRTRIEFITEKFVRTDFQSGCEFSEEFDRALPGYFGFQGIGRLWNRYWNLEGFWMPVNIWTGALGWVTVSSTLQVAIFSKKTSL